MRYFYGDLLFTENIAQFLVNIYSSVLYFILQNKKFITKVRMLLSRLSCWHPVQLFKSFKLFNQYFPLKVNLKKPIAHIESKLGFCKFRRITMFLDKVGINLRLANATGSGKRTRWSNVAKFFNSEFSMVLKKSDRLKSPNYQKIIDANWINFKLNKYLIHYIWMARYVELKCSIWSPSIGRSANHLEHAVWRCVLKNISKIA